MKKLLLCLFLVACNETQQGAPAPEQKGVQLSYVKDRRTNLCFALSYVGEYPIGTATIFTNVPCSSEVEQLISK
jgi:hypothetical protein